MAKIPQKHPSASDPSSDARLQDLEDELAAMRLILTLTLGEQRARREDGKEWLADLKRMTLSSLSNQKAARAERIADFVTKFYDRIESAVTKVIRRKTTH